MPLDLIYREVRRVKTALTQRVWHVDDNAAIGVGALIIFIAMILVAGIAASVIIQTINSLQQQALITGEQTSQDISTGIRVTYVSGHKSGTTLDQIAIYIRPIAGSGGIDLNYTYISITDQDTQVILNFSDTCYSNSISGGLFGTLDSTKLTASTYGIMEIRDIDNSSTSSNPVINDDDFVVLLVNTSACFSGLGTRKEVSGKVIPEQGLSGVISFTTPSAFVDIIIDLQ